MPRSIQQLDVQESIDEGCLSDILVADRYDLRSVLEKIGDRIFLGLHEDLCWRAIITSYSGLRLVARQDSISSTGTIVLGLINELIAPGELRYVERRVHSELLEEIQISKGELLRVQSLWGFLDHLLADALRFHRAEFAQDEAVPTLLTLPQILLRLGGV